MDNPYSIKRKLSLDDIRLANIPRKYWEVEYEVIQEGMHREPFKRFIQGMPKMLESGWGMFFHGSLGSGKTALAILILKEAMRHGGRGYFMRAWEVKHAVTNKIPYSRDETVEARMRDAQMLVIDDLGREYTPVGPRWNEQFFEDLVRHRTSEIRSTIITTNFPLAEMEVMYGKGFLSVCKETMAFVEVLGKNLHETRKIEDELTA